ncbi:MAG TPA: TlpA disulfide reductase family protein [Bryobacteraceae bacterium]|nr:TlpA disulfide reductase family protein [Bryobacteraceae bacterium]
MRTALLALFITLGVSVQAAAPVPRPSKEFTVAVPGGQQILLSSLKGKVAVVQFLFTWCPHCQAFSKILTQLNNEYSSRGFQALGVAFDDDDPKTPPLKDKAVAYGQQYAGFPVGAANRSTVFGYLGLSELQRIGVPQIVVIDRKGVIREQSPGEGGGPLGDPAHLKPLIESLLAEGAPAKAPAKTGDSKKKAADKKASE